MANLEWVLRGVDRPVRAALELAEGPLWRILLPGAMGLALVALSHEFAVWLAPRHSVPPGFDALRPALEALAVVCPGAFVAGGLVHLKTSNHLRAAAMSLGILVGGLLSFSLFPLTAFLAVAMPDLPPLSALLVAIAFLGGTASIHRRVVAADGSPSGRVFARAVSVLLLAVFVLRLPGWSSLLIGGAKW